MSDKRLFEITSPQCAVSSAVDKTILMGHGGGGSLTRDLIAEVFLEAFGNDCLNQLQDASVFPVEANRLAITTDSFVVQPLFFPGGSIGDLAVNGTINDLAMRGAEPLYLTASFILEEGLSIEKLRLIANDMANAAYEAGVKIIAGDTKVVEKGHGDGCYITTSGIGVLKDGVEIASQNAGPGDAVLVSGSIGDHGMAIMSVREGLQFDSDIQSDTAAMNGLVSGILHVCPKVKVLRDPTRGGLAATLQEIAVASDCGIEIEEEQVPIKPIVQSACDILGFDPLLVANEGKLVCVVCEDDALAVLHEMRNHTLGRDAALIGKIVPEHAQTVVAKTPIGAQRIITLPRGEQLPRIC